MENKILSMVAEAKSMLNSATIDASRYDEMVNFVIKNDAKLASNPHFRQLAELLADVAYKHNKKTVAETRENFGLNSCAG